MSEKDHGQALIEQIKEFLEEKGLEPKLLKTRSACRLEYSYDQVLYECYIIVEYKLSMIQFYFIPPMSIEGVFLPAIAEYLTRVNYRMTFGNFEMDFSDGEISYKKVIKWREKMVQMEEIIDGIKSGVSMWSMYLPGLIAICKEGITPVEALKWVR